MPRAPRPVDACIGRVSEIAAVEAALRGSRLVTLAGPGGVGKTRIALEVAWSVDDTYPDGVWFVPLGDLDLSADRASVAGAVLTGLGIADQSARPPEDKLAAHLADRRLLLVLDNCEHILPLVTPVVRDLLAASAGLRLLTTSRESLGLTGERVLAVPPLSVPAPSSVSTGTRVKELLESDAVRLLVERARAVDPDFEIGVDDARAVAELTAQLDGLPLAIELCATRLRSLSVGQLLERLNGRLDMEPRDPGGHEPRHRSLRGVIDWSYELCSPSHQVLWTRLAVFPTSFDIAAAEDVCGFDELARDEVLDGIDRLVARSVLLTERLPGGMRYRMLSTIREYAMERLIASGEVAPLRRRHRDYYLARISSVVRGWARPTHVDALQEMDAERPHYAAALSWSAVVEEEHDAGLEFAATLRYHWLSGGHLAEGRRWLALFLDKEGISTPTRGHGLWVASWVSMLQGDLDGAARYIDALAGLADEIDVEAHIHHWTGLLEVFSGRAEDAIVHLDRAATGHRRRGADALEMSARFMQSYALASVGRGAEAESVATDVVDRAGTTGDHLNHGWAWWMRAYARWKLGDPAAAEDALREVLLVQRNFRDRVCIAGTVALLAVVAESRGDAARADELAVTAVGLFTAIGTEPESLGWDFSRAWTATAATIAARSGVDDLATVARAVIVDQDEAQIVRDLIEQLGRPRTGAAHDAEPLAVLTRREREVAGLVAAGLTNREIAAQLVIAPRTADGHVERILSKLGVRRRSMVAALVVSAAAPAEPANSPHRGAADDPRRPFGL
ncbi:ATP-binding protein [Pseudonocardia abyssalis]|uniref:LuxR family transcriptional regulator n=1 Tax=Pseudonocardia abyssalis TaxID=2792008 RepID=A0ABS6URK5_9PSEU|nr:LuxR C-terminal-related transcriptional regulator [Pseudonocardia abyssalis]MBW0114288.1 LuxR family transcriptional regulator [Pseudonocardia abyssalis]MBW0134850.1 LuxR family transcriptional regulator [Pseudonocardia abyssalis]